MIRQGPAALLAMLLAAICVITVSAGELSPIGAGTAIVFSPDFADPENHLFYESLGFLYLESPDWRTVVEQIRSHNANDSETPVRVVLVESHGTNGHGLKLQVSKEPSAERSYISVGALQENLEGTGVEWVILSACNSGRLLRPEIYNTLDRDVDDPLFLPATLGVIDASPEFDAQNSDVRVLRRAQSNLESLMHGATSELPLAARDELHGRDASWRFAVSTMLIQILTEDPSLDLIAEGFVREKSRADLSAERSEALFQRFSRFLGSTASATTGTREGESPIVIALR